MPGTRTSPLLVRLCLHVCAALAALACTGPPGDADAPAAGSERTGSAESGCSAGCSRLHPDCSGWVRLAYDVAPSGAVENAQVIASCPAGRHDAAALGVVSGWRYPESETGSRDIRIQIDFAEKPAPAEEPARQRGGPPVEDPAARP